MTRVSIACATLCLLPLCGCSSAPVAAPPKVVEIPKAVPVPENCRTLRRLELPDGTSAQTVMEKQHELIVQYEEQVKACAAGK